MLKKDYEAYLDNVLEEKDYELNLVGNIINPAVGNVYNNGILIKSPVEFNN
ncbi:MAG: hypothetical protein ACTTID_03060 [Bacillales bacterium]